MCSGIFMCCGIIMSYYVITTGNNTKARNHYLLNVNVRFELLFNTVNALTCTDKLLNNISVDGPEY